MVQLLSFLDLFVYQVRNILDIIFLYLQMDNRFDGLTSGLQQQRSNPPLLGNHAARLEQFGMRFDDLNRIRVLGLYRIYLYTMLR